MREMKTKLKRENEMNEVSRRQRLCELFEKYSCNPQYEYQGEYLELEEYLELMEEFLEK